MNSQKMNDTQSRLLTILNSYGDIVELDWKFDSDTIIQELKSVDNWIDGSNHKKGLPLTGSPEQLDLTSKDDREGEAEAAGSVCDEGKAWHLPQEDGKASIETITIERGTMNATSGHAFAENAHV